MPVYEGGLFVGDSCNIELSIAIDYYVGNYDDSYDNPGGNGNNGSRYEAVLTPAVS